MRVIFVPVADRPECAVALHKAFDLARDLDASVIGCHIRPHTTSKVSLPAGLTTPVAAAAEAEWLSAWRPRAKKQTATSARALFGRLAAAEGFDVHKSPRAKPGAIWMEKTGSPQKVLSILGPVSDLLVVSRPESKNATIARLFLMAALFDSARPVLVLPQERTAPVGKHICIAWNQSAEAARAVAAALPLLQLAKQVVIASSGPENRLGPKSSHLVSYLKSWGVKAQREQSPGDDHAKELLATYRKTRSDLMVMGAYSRNRFSQMLFGGVTDFMLHRASIPVLMIHS